GVGYGMVRDCRDLVAGNQESGVIWRWRKKGSEDIKDKLDLDQNGSPVDVTKYRSMIGALMYLTSSRPDIIHATCLYARYQAKTTEKHLKEVKRIFRYLQGIVNMGLWYMKDSGFKLTGFSYADYAGCKDTFKSTFGGAQFLGEKLVSWSSKKQYCTKLSTAEAEYVSLSASIAISCNPVQHSRTKHIVVRYHFIKEHVEKGTIELYFFKPDYQLADLFTKSLQVDRFNYLVCCLGMRSLSPQELERLAKSRSAENKRRLENNPRDNRGQQSVFKQENIGGQNVARGYTARNNERKRYVGSLTYYNKCKLYHKGPYTVRYGDCKRVGHQTRDCRSAAAALNTQIGAIRNQSGIVCYECGRPGHFRKDCPKLRNQNHGNQTGNKTSNKTGSNEATGKAYGIRGGATPDSNVITGTFRLNNCYASLLFDSGVDRSFMSSTFSALLDVAPSTLDTSYAVELADGRNSKTNIILRGCTLGLLDAKNHTMIVCDEKVVRIPYGDEVLITQSDDIDGRIMPKKEEDKSEERRIEDVPIIWEFSKVFPEDFSGLPPARQVKFQIDLVPGAAPVARSLYRLAPAEMQELSTQLQELSDKGFIRPSSSP
nr:putative reverse transcriptase domain-containing protein [Tanacetum cinerariifolium]